MFYNKAKRQDEIARLKSQVMRFEATIENMQVEKREYQQDTRLAERTSELAQKENTDLKSQIDSLQKELKTEADARIAAEKEVAETDLMISEAKTTAVEEANGKIEGLREENEKLRIKVGSLESKVEMQDKALDVAGDIIDIKDLVSKIIGKLPEINLSSLTVNANASKK